jgi:hypothetical protein
MAIRASTRATQIDVLSRVDSWAGLLQSSLDTGAGVSVADAAQIMVMIASGTLGVGGAITWEGSLNNVDWFPLTSQIGTPAAIVQTALLTPAMVQERPLYVRPRVTAGDGTTALVASVVTKRPIA